jgi:hypothetical protein
VTLEDRKYLPVHRYQTLELVEFITEESIDRVFSQVSASLYTLEVVAQLEIKPEDMVSGITYPPRHNYHRTRRIQCIGRLWPKKVQQNGLKGMRLSSAGDL